MIAMSIIDIYAFDPSSSVIQHESSDYIVRFLKRNKIEEKLEQQCLVFVNLNEASSAATYNAQVGQLVKLVSVLKDVIEAVENTPRSNSLFFSGPNYGLLGACLRYTRISGAITLFNVWYDEYITRRQFDVKGFEHKFQHELSGNYVPWYINMQGLANYIAGCDIPGNTLVSNMTKANADGDTGAQFGSLADIRAPTINSYLSELCSDTLQIIDCNYPLQEIIVEQQESLVLFGKQTGQYNNLDTRLRNIRSLYDHFFGVVYRNPRTYLLNAQVVGNNERLTPIILPLNVSSMTRDAFLQLWPQDVADAERAFPPPRIGR